MKQNYIEIADTLDRNIPSINKIDYFPVGTKYKYKGREYTIDNKHVKYDLSQEG